MVRRHFPLVLVAAASIAVMAAAPAVDAKRTATDESCSTPTLTGPAQARVGDAYTVDGCGFDAGSVVPLEIAEAGGCCIALNMVADGYGRFSYTSAVWAAGTYGVRAWVPRNGSGRWRLAASWSFEAYP